jgi:hypothetical protein
MKRGSKVLRSWVTLQGGSRDLNLERGSLPAEGRRRLTQGWRVGDSDESQISATNCSLQSRQLRSQHSLKKEGGAPIKKEERQSTSVVGKGGRQLNKEKKKGRWSASYLRKKKGELISVLSISVTNLILYWAWWVGYRSASSQWKELFSIEPGGIDLGKYLLRSGSWTAVSKITSNLLLLLLLSGYPDGGH